jgi:transcriptional regulator with XRE-family HTH domain
MLRIRALREAKRWSRAKLARRARMAAADEGKIESGRLRPYPSQLRKLARALRVPIDKAESLLAEADPGTEATDGERR